MDKRACAVGAGSAATDARACRYRPVPLETDTADGCSCADNGPRRAQPTGEPR